MCIGEERVLSTSDLIADCNIVEDHSAVRGGDFSSEVTFNVFSIFPEFVFSARESEFGRFDGGIPGACPLATHLDPLGRLCPSKGDLSCSHVSSVLFRSGNMVQ